MTELDDGARRERALRRVGQLRSFYVHVLAFALGNAAAFLINWMTLGSGDHSWWFQWGLVVWAVALAVHGLTVVSRNSWLGPRWEHRKVGQYLRDEGQPAVPAADAPASPHQ